MQAITNEKGKFNLKAEQDLNNDTLQFSHVSYKTVKITLSEFRKLNSIITLKQKSEDLSEITVQANGKLKLQSKLAFSKLTAMKYPIFSFGSFLKDDKIYVIGGDASYESDAWKKITKEKPSQTLKDLQDELQRNPSFLHYKENLCIYDIKTDQWEISKIKFKKRAYHNILYYNNMTYVLGGKRISLNGKFEYLQDEIEVFDMNKNTISIDKTNPHQASNLASFIYKDNIIAIGGSVKMSEKGKKDFTNKVHLYNINTGYWYELSDMPIAKEVNGILIGDNIFLIGGNNEKMLPEIEILNLITEKWQTVGQLFSSLERPAITNNNNIIYFFEDTKMYTFNIETKTLKEYLIDLPLKFSAIHFFNNKLYIVGGCVSNDYSRTASNNTYSISIDEFEKTAPNKTKILSVQSNTQAAN